MRAWLVALSLLLFLPFRAQAQFQQPSRFASARISGPPAIPGLVDDALPRGCSRPIVVNVAMGAAAGALAMGVVVIAASPLLALARSGDGGRVDLNPYMIGAAVVGAAVGGVDHLTRCRPSPPLIAAQLGVMRGKYVDDYGNAFDISDTLFAQLPHGRFHIVERSESEQYVIAWNDSSNTNAPGKWTRIDWMRFTGMEPYTWGFCLTVYDAPTRHEARAATPPDRANPRRGCSGYPFSRMKPAP